MKIAFGPQILELNPSGESYLATLDGRTVPVQVLRAENGQMDLLIDGVKVQAYISSDGANRWVTIDGHTVMHTKTSGAKQGVRHEHAGGLTAPMPGLVQSISVHAGEVVRKGQTLAVIEAMKMEIRIQALKDGKVKTIHVKQGQTVEREQILIEMED